MSPDSGSPTSDPAKEGDVRAGSEAVAVSVAVATVSDSPEGKSAHTLVVDDGESRAAAPVGTTEPSSMEMDDESFHGDATAFTMTLDDLADANPPDQLYEDLTGERAKSPMDECAAATVTHDNQRDHEHDTQDSPSNQHEEQHYPGKEQASTTRTPTPTRASPIKVDGHATPPTPPPPPVATRKSPRRSASSASKTSSGTAKKAASGTKRSNQSQSLPTQAFSWNDILHVQNLIERCLQQLLTKNDIVLTLQAQAKVDPAFTAVVWQKLEEQNPAFFRAYAMQLQLKEQITAFNFLVSQQKEMMAKASGNAAFMSFLASSDARKTQRQAMVRQSRMGAIPQARGRTNTPSPHPNTIQLGSSSGPPTSAGMDTMSSSTSQAFPLSSPLPLPSPMKTDLDTHAFFS